MKQATTCILLLQSLSAAFGKYVYIQKNRSWNQAQEYCREFHTDLAPVSTERDIKLLRRLTDNINYYYWIGLERASTNGETWMWSGGGNVSNFFWDEGQPDNWQGEDYGLIYNYKWHNSGPDSSIPFFCYNVVVVRQKMAWEEALEYCRKHHRDLASVASQTEMLLIQKELEKNFTTEYLWIALHFFPGRWLWVDRQPLKYKAWGETGEPSCPEVNLECGALKVLGWTQHNNAGALLSTNSTVTSTNINSGNAETKDNAGGLRGSDVASNIEGIEWDTPDCEEKHNFVCY